MHPIPPRRRVLRYMAGVVALAFAGATCKDLTGPTGLAADGGLVVLTYMGARGPTGAVELTAGDTVAPPVEVRIDGVVVTRARYVFTIRDTSLSGPADDIVKVQGGDTLIAVNRGRAKIIATLVGATIGGKIDPTDKIADTVDVVVSPAANGLNVARLTLTSLGETLPITAFSTDANGARVRLGRVDWSSSAPGVLNVSAGVTAADTNVATLTAVGNGTATITALFDSVQTVTRTFVVQQRLHHYVLTSPSLVNGEITLASLHDSAFVTATPLDSLNVPLTAGAQTPAPLSFISSAADRAAVNSVTGTIEALLNTDPAVPAFVYGTISGTAKSDTLTVRVKQLAVSLTIIGKRADTIPSLGATKDLAAIVKDARGNDIQTGITWLPRNVAVVRYQSLPTDQLVAVDTGTTYVRATRDQQVDSIRVTVTNNPETVTLTPDTLYLRSVNELKRFTDIVLRNSKGDRLTSGIPITWSSSNTAVVDARADSTMLAVAVGAADVTATTPNGRSATSRVVVTNAPASIDITATSATLASVGDTLLNTSVTITNALGAALPRSAANWTSDNQAVATVAVDASANVYIVAAGAGIAHIRAASPLDPNTVNDEIVVTVTNAATAINVSPAAPAALTAFGATINFSATVLNQANRPISGAQVTWSVLAGGTSFLSIDPNTGVATASGNGSATVRATSASVTQDVTVTVAQTVSTARSTIVPAATTLAADGTSNTTVTVQLKDANDNNVLNATPTPVLATSLGTLGAVASIGSGAFTATLTAGTTSGAASITGTVGGLAIANSGSVSFTSGAAARYIVTPNSLTPVAGSSVTVRAQLADANNNPIATAGNTVQFSSTNGGSFTPANGQATTDVTGAATITFTTNVSASSHTITATTAGITGSSQAIVSTAGAATNYLVTTSTTSPAAGSAVTISAQLRDANNNPVAQQGQTVNWSKSDANGSFPGGATDASTTNASGVATITLTTHTVAGTSTTVTATTGSATGTSGTITTAAGAAAQMALSAGNGQTAAAGSTVATAPAVLVTDANSNPVAGATVYFAVASGGGSASGLVTLTNASGIATVGSWTLGNVVGTNTMTATIPGIAGSPVTFTATSQGTASLTVSQNGNETGPTNIVYTVTLSATNNSGAPVTFDVTNSGGTAVSGSDFIAFGGVAAISVPVGATTGSLSVTVLDDALMEGTETVQATISNSSNAAVSIIGATATANLLDNDATTAVLSVSQQGDEAGLVGIQYTVTLSRANNTGAPITFDVANVGGTATSGSDFTAFGGAAAISVANGASTGTLTVPVLQDALLEGTETVQATLSNPSNAAVTISVPTATANIADDETATADLSVTQNGNEAGPQNIVYRVTLSAANNTGAQITFTVANSGGTATSGSDFAAFGGAAVLSVANGATTATLTVPVLNDALLENTETVQATISSPSLAAVSITTATATATILEEGATAVLTPTQNGVEAVTPTHIVFTVTLNKTNATGLAIAFDVANTPGGQTATSGADYVAFGGAGAAILPNGSATGSFPVTVLNDALLEATETVNATISNPTNGAVTITGATATASIIDNETATAVLSVAQDGNEAGTVSIIYRVTLSRANNTGAPITFAVSNSGGTATSGSDFAPFGGATALSVPNGATTGALTVPVNDDALLEATETVEASISDPSLASVTITAPTATANILESGDVAILSATDATEGNNVVFTVALTKQNATGAPITFTLARTGGTSTAGTDHGVVPATISIANGATSGIANVGTIDDALLENTETLSAQISAPSNASVVFGAGTDVASANILESGATATLSATSPTEGNDVVFAVTLGKQNVTGSAIDFTFAKAGGSTDATDYGVVPATISVANNQSSGTANLTTIDDALLETAETFDARISAPTNPAVVFSGGSDLATATINESGATATLSATNVTEGTDIVFTITLSKTNVTGSAIDFTFANAGTGTATGADVGTLNTISVPNNASSGSANLSTIDDNLLENNETFDARISAPTNPNVSFAASSDVATSIIAESGATVELVTQTNGVENPNQSIVYRVELMHNGSAKTNVTGGAITVDYSDATAANLGTATVGLDYLAFAGTATIANGAANTTFSVTVIDDGTVPAELAETVYAQIANLVGPASVTLGTALSVATIAAN